MEKRRIKIILSAVTVMTVAGSGISCAWEAGKRKKVAEVRTDASDLEGGLTEEKVREPLLRLFRLCADSEFGDLAELLGNGSNPGGYVAGNCLGQSFLCLKRNMTGVMTLRGDDDTGRESFSTTGELFHYPTYMISCQTGESLSDNFTLCLENRTWMFENGEFASVYCVGLTNRTRRLSYRFPDTCIKNTWDIPVDFDDLESDFAKITGAVEEGRAVGPP